MNIAFAHDGGSHAVADPGWALLAEWTFDPVFAIPLLLAWFYLRGYRKYRRGGGHTFPRWRPAMFALGVTVIGIALLSPIDLLADRSFTFHMVQHELLIWVGIPLLLLGAPFIPVIRGLPDVLKKGAFIPFARIPTVRRGVLFLTRPLIGLALLEVSLFFWHYPPFYDAALFNEGVHYLEHFCFLAAAMLFWWNLVTPYPFPSRLHFLLRILTIFASGIFNGALSAMIVFSDRVHYGYRLQPEFWGMSILQDQQLGSMLMWVMGAMLRLIAITIIFIVYAYEENAKEPGRGGVLRTGGMPQNA